MSADLMNMPFSFDATQVKPAGEFTLLPDGWYNVFGKEVKVIPAGSGKGAFAAFSLVVMDGENKGDVYTERMNLWHENQQTMDIAKQSLSAMCHVVSYFKISSIADMQNLLNKPFKIKIVIQDYKDTQTGEPRKRNAIKGWRDANDCEPGKSTPAQQPSAAPQQVASQFASAPVQQAPAPQQAWPQQQPMQQPMTQQPQAQAWPTQAPQQPAQMMPQQQPMQQPQAAPMGWVPPTSNGAVPDWARK